MSMIYGNMVGGAFPVKTDPTLTKEGKPADAKVVGDKIAKLKEEEGYFVPAYKGGMLKDYDLICKKNGQQENIQIKLNLSKDTYNKYKKKGLIIYCVSKSKKIINPEITIFDYQDIEKQIKDKLDTKKWLSQTLDWVYIMES